MVELGSEKTFTELGLEDASIEATVLGFVVTRGMFTQYHQRQSIVSCLRLFDAAFVAGSVKVYLDHYGQFAGYVLLAQVDDLTHDALVKHGTVALQSAKAGRGRNLWMVDFLAVHGYARQVAWAACDQLLRTSSAVSYFRYKQREHVAKQANEKDVARLLHIANGDLEVNDLSLLRQKDMQGLLHDARGEAIGSERVGKALKLARSSNEFANLPVHEALYRLQTPIAMNQIKFYLSGNGDVGGFITWAWIDDQLQSASSAPPLHYLHPSEWNKGRNLMLCDFVLTDSVRSSMVADVIGRWFPAETVILHPKFANRDLGYSFSVWSPENRIKMIEWLVERPDVKHRKAVVQI
jgi:hemolysin-activating ACP:hemolysin acyltransferase